MSQRPDDKRGGVTRTTGNGNSKASHDKKRVTSLEYRIWCAEHIGWPALADSFRRDLAALKGMA